MMYFIFLRRMLCLDRQIFLRPLSVDSVFLVLFLKRRSILFIIRLPLPGRYVYCTFVVKAEISYFLYLACKG